MCVLYLQAELLQDKQPSKNLFANAHKLIKLLSSKSLMIGYIYIQLKPLQCKLAHARVFSAGGRGRLQMFAGRILITQNQRPLTMHAHMHLCTQSSLHICNMMRSVVILGNAWGVNSFHTATGLFEGNQYNYNQVEHML